MRSAGGPLGLSPWVQRAGLPSRGAGGLQGAARQAGRPLTAFYNQTASTQASPPAACSNRLTALPEDLAELAQLRVLRLKYNALAALPPVLAALPRLATLELSGNQCEVLDADVLAQLTALR